MTTNRAGLLVGLDTLLHRLGRDPSPPLAMIRAEAPPARDAARQPRLPLVGAAAARRACAALLDEGEVAALSRAGLF